MHRCQSKKMSIKYRNGYSLKQLYICMRLLRTCQRKISISEDGSHLLFVEVAVTPDSKVEAPWLESKLPAKMAFWLFYITTWRATWQLGSWDTFLSQRYSSHLLSWPSRQELVVFFGVVLIFPEITIGFITNFLLSVEIVGHNMAWEMSGHSRAVFGENITNVDTS